MSAHVETFEGSGALDVCEDCGAWVFPECQGEEGAGVCDDGVFRCASCRFPEYQTDWAEGEDSGPPPFSAIGLLTYDSETDTLE